MLLINKRPSNVLSENFITESYFSGDMNYFEVFQEMLQYEKIFQVPLINKQTRYGFTKSFELFRMFQEFLQEETISQS